MINRSIQRLITNNQSSNWPSVLAVRNFSSNQLRSGAGSTRFNEPSGWLFGERPLKEGQKRVREDWEIIWYVGFWGTTLFGIITQVYKPNKSITTWARKEAEENMEKPTYEKS
ncbi:ESSS subunit of NADH:ubiquinone oxidoreductase-domain-containing protein [Phakopsora pachyrhizi]|uniref:NADH dehydrogenase [ubiquinone] 1 beta subcomplex subunit 11, mitochondrial n=1 Tax=Phakopsora pachyrhizi TaxID=170000 RepID=A0AAV0AQB1_PHAPC|nr:ESSS subunit of NADH:ubiquinone oxidoreductase-domain-containing protein [Phakopsora pachyrhizi]